MRKILTAFLCSIVFVGGISYTAIADYLATAGSGLTFGSIDLAGIKFPAFIGCDPTTAKQCWSISAAGAVKVDGSAVTQPVSVASGQIVDGGNVALGTKADASTCTTGNTAMSCWRQIDADIKATGTIQGTAANGVNVTGNPLQSGGRAQNAEITTVTNGQQVAAAFDLAGKQIVLLYANPENFVSGGTAAMTATTSTSLIAAPAAGLRNYLTHLVCGNSHATVGTFLLVQDGSGGATIYEGYAAAVGGGFSMTLPTPLRQPTTATALFVQNVTTGANVICFGSGYKGA